VEITGFISEAARAAAIARGYPTISEIGFPSELYLGSFELPAEGGWGEAGRIAQAKAAELGFQVEYESFVFPSDDDAEDEYQAAPCRMRWIFRKIESSGH
jgi:hypothetical protein